MHKPKSRRHVTAARARWRAAEIRAEQKRIDCVPAREPAHDNREPIRLDLRSAGGKGWIIEPRAGYIGWRLRDEDSGEVSVCAALKTLMHRLADELPRTLGRRSADCV